MANSEYYNTRGEQAKQFQRYLNSQGAGLAVDGIWGKKTEAAYQANKESFDAWRAGNSDTSSNYGQSGDSVKQMQQQLNSQGAGLAVDGIWGPKTEAAYQASQGGSSGAGSGSSDPGGSGSTTTAGISSSDLEDLLGQYQTPSYTPKTEQQLRDEAKAQYASQYNAQKLAAEQKNAAYQQSINAQIEALGQQLAENQAETARQYQLNGAQLQRMLTARGMGRSTYAGDVAQNNLNALAGALSKLLTSYNTSANALRSQGALYAQQTADQLAQLLSDNATNVQNAYNQLKDADLERQQAAQSAYNQLVGNLQQMLSDRNLTQQQLAESIRQFNEQQKLAYAQLKG